VYSASTFNQNSGISLITTPETAAGLADAIQNAAATRRERIHLAVQDLTQPDDGREANLSYEIKYLPGKGRGVVARQGIKKFDIIMTGFPAMIIDDIFFPPLSDGLAPAESPHLFQLALEQLSDSKRFLALARSMGGNVHVVEDIIRTNAFGLSLNGRAHKGLYPEIAVSTKSSSNV
jgi:hypothetical protein